jgi:nucleoside-diphosphate-sugar epimerase
MNVLMVGGAGRVGTFITPYLREHHDLRILDVRPPSHDGVDYVEGSVLDQAALRRALDGMDVFVNLMMRSPQGGSSTEQTLEQITDNYTTNTLGLHMLLFTAQELGVTRGVHTSTMSVHYRERETYRGEEQVPLDSPSVYGLTKGLGERICQYFAEWFDMSLIALRITAPRERDAYRRERIDPPAHVVEGRLFVTDEQDLAQAYLAALEVVQVGSGRFDAVFIAGDEDERAHNLTKARRLLGWEPRSHLLLGDGEDQ